MEIPEHQCQGPPPLQLLGSLDYFEQQSPMPWLDLQETVWWVLPQAFASHRLKFFWKQCSQHKFSCFCSDAKVERHPYYQISLLRAAKQKMLAKWIPQYASGSSLFKFITKCWYKPFYKFLGMHWIYIPQAKHAEWAACLIYNNM